MKNTIINLDIIFISEKKLIIDLIENASPMSEKIYTARNTKYVLEINAGLVKSLDINIGWDGTYKGQNCQDGTYIWKINLTDFNEKEYNYVGHINLVR